MRTIHLVIENQFPWFYYKRLCRCLDGERDKGALDKATHHKDSSRFPPSIIPQAPLPRAATLSRLLGRALLLTRETITDDISEEMLISVLV